MATNALENKLEALTESNDDTDISEEDVDSAPDWLRRMCDEVRQESLSRALDVPRHEPRVLVRPHDASMSVPTASQGLASQSSETRSGSNGAAP
jgi:hypothetical protein